MGVFEVNKHNEELDGILGELGMTPAAKAKRVHQKIIKRICYFFDNLFYPEFEAINEGEIAETDSKIPDVCIWTQDNTPILIIEITTFSKENDNIRKLRNFFKEYPNILECFLFNYETEKWYEVNKKLEKIENSFSNYFNIDFKDSLKNFNIKKEIEKDIKIRDRNKKK